MSLRCFGCRFPIQANRKTERCGACRKILHMDCLTRHLCVPVNGQGIPVTPAFMTPTPVVMVQTSTQMDNEPLPVRLIESPKPSPVELPTPSEEQPRMTTIPDPPAPKPVTTKPTTPLSKRAAMVERFVKLLAEERELNGWLTKLQAERKAIGDALSEETV